MIRPEYSKFINFTKEIFDTNEFIPLHEPIFFGNEKKYILDTIDSTFVSSIGKYVDQFESMIAKFTGTKKAIAVVNGTCALQVALRLAGVKSNEEVITQALTFVATANAINYLNCDPIFIDVDLDNMGLSPDSLEDFLYKFAELRDDGTYNKKTGKKISACVPMHTFGLMCRIDKIINICSKWKIQVVEDSAEALGSKYKNKSAGSFGLLSAFSFNGNKIITSGGGGAITTNDFSIGEKAKYLTTTAKKPHKWEYVHDELGYNFRMPNINAALACAQLEKIDNIKSSKKKLFNEYKSFFRNYEDITIIDIPKHTNWNYWLFSVKLKNKDSREKFLDQTNKNGVMTRPIWRLMYKLPMYKHCQKDAQHNAEYLEERIINIPSNVKI